MPPAAVQLVVAHHLVIVQQVQQDHLPLAANDAEGISVGRARQIVILFSVFEAILTPPLCLPHSIAKPHTDFNPNTIFYDSIRFKSCILDVFPILVYS